jgi:hypothetical protein
MRSLVSRLVVVLFFFGFFGGISWAQTSASIAGTVQDTSGAAVPGVTVTVTNVETGTARTATTDDRGYYQVLSLQVGQYEVSAEAAGFKKVLRKGIDLTVGQQAVIPISLEVGQVQEQVTVTAEVPVIDASTASTGGLVEEQAVKDLPLNGRSYDSLITLNPGTSSITTRLRPTAANVGQGYLFNVNGDRSNDNLFMVNGIEFTGASRIGPTPGGASGQLLGVDAVREFNVESTTYGAEYGKRSGGQVNIVTQSGGNQFHGTAFEFARNAALDATDFITNAAGKTKPAFERNDFGAAAGGPIRKDKTFIFGNYEGYRQTLTQTQLAIVPDANARQGFLPIGPGGSLVNVGVAPGMVPYFAMYPAANGPELGGGLAESFNNAAFPVREDFGNVRLDQHFSDKDSLSGAYTVDDGTKTTPFADPNSGSVLAIRQQVFSLQETHIFSANTINTFKVGFSRGAFYSDSFPLVPFSPSLSIVPGRPMGSVTVGGGGGSAEAASVSVFGNGDVNSHEYRNLYTYTDDVQIAKGKHQFNFGLWFQRVQQDSAGVEAGYGSVTFLSLQDFLQGNAFTLSGGGNGDVVGARQWETAAYAQDTIRATNTLTVTLGLRYEPTNGWHEIGGREQTSVLGPNGLLEQVQPSGPLMYEITGPAVMQNTSLKNVAPRLGLAWDIFGKGKTVLHAGFGTYYDELDDRNFKITEGYPIDVVGSFRDTTFPQQLPVLPAGSPLPAGSLLPSGGWDPTARTPIVEQWSFSIQQQITPSTGLTVGYVGSHGYHFIDAGDTNPTYSVICPAAPCPAGIPAGTQYFPSGAQSARLFPLTGPAALWQDSGHNSYNALQVDLRQRLARGLNFRTNFTWEKSMDNQSFPVGGYQGNCPNVYSQVLNPNADYSLSCADIPYRFSFDGGYALPIGQGRALLGGARGVTGKLVSGWQLEGIITWQSGLPISPLDGFNNSRDGNTGTPDRPSWNPNFSGNLYPHTLNEWFNPNAFILAPAGTYGNVGRNVLEGPGLADADLSLVKQTKLSERFNLELRGEFFNALNRANFGLPNYTLFNNKGARSGSAGVITSMLTDPREIQLGLKLGW